MKYLRMFFHSLGYGVWLTGQIIKESTVMAVDTLGTGRKIAPVVLYYPLRVTKERDIAAFIASITMTPGTLALAGAVYVFVSARAMYLAPDAISQINMIGPAAGVGLPLLILSNLVYSWGEIGFDFGVFLRAIAAIFTLLVIQAVGSYIMGRALHATHWDHTVPLSGGERAKEPK